MRKSTDERREEIVQGVLEVAAEKGLGNVTTQAIAEKVGIAQPTIFRHFKSRDEIFRAAMEWIADRLFAALEGLFSTDMPADQRLRQLLERQLKFISKRKGIPRLLFSDRLHLEDPGLKRTVRAIMRRYTERVAAVIEDGRTSGLFREDLDPQETAIMIAAVFQGMVMRWSIYEFEYPLEEQLDAIWRFIWPVLRPE